ncbi:uncharacterized protein PHALS_01283 [Plasmopara halstedii]|uniref:Uncharacterized protein n=1 Tax=Plasmopara halstedii TaxID=4781 RepID=A0A0P1AU81_PLAHL|nr:uncharacterized protein PHALS_01283 [Plasmopara halstedii]CEG44960.1 hypothetical protein PHALS_01283 [Plasmopara halstedii]|eukprot:XP_024581329.1 hypothetical protein PHALS_01283 [Plasmopara halstedii]
MSARGDNQYRTRSSSAKRSLSFSSPCTRVVSPPSLSPSQDKPTDRVLTFLQSARDRNVPVRSGKWSTAEDAYLAKLIWLFKSGILADMEPKTSLRSFLAVMLNCCPMRISKKQMHGHNFMGKIKYMPQVTQMTEQQYETLCREVRTLRDAFLQAWAKDEYARRNSTVEMCDSSFQEWFNKVVALVPTPKLVRRSILQSTKKRRIESFNTLTAQMEDVTTQKVQNLATAQPQPETQEQDSVQTNAFITMLEPAEIISEKSAPVPESNSGYKVMMLPAAYCDEIGSMEDWLDLSHTDAHWTDTNSDNPGEVCYTLCEDQVQVSVHMSDQDPAANALSMTRQSSKLLIDFGAPSCWSTSEEPKSLYDYSHWSETDFSNELAMGIDPNVFNWDDMLPLPQVTNSPTLNFP